MDELQKRINRMRRWYKETARRYHNNLKRLHAFIYYLYDKEGYSRKELAKLFDLTYTRIGQIINEQRKEKK